MRDGERDSEGEAREVGERAGEREGGGDVFGDDEEARLRYFERRFIREDDRMLRELGVRHRRLADALGGDGGAGMNGGAEVGGGGERGKGSRRRGSGVRV